MADISSSYPKALSYSVKQLAGQMSRIGTKLTFDRTTGIAPNDVVSVKLPNSSLVDLRTFAFFYKFSTSATTGTFIHPRYSSSILERVALVVNGITVSQINNYNLLYNTLMDMEGSSFDQLSKRNANCEFFDPSIRILSSDPSSSADVALSGDNWLKSGVSAPSKIDGTICNWLGFLNSTSTPIIDTGDLGDVFIQFSFANPYILPANFNSTALTLAGASYTLDDIYCTVDVISFAENDYYNMKASKLQSSGLSIGFYDYLNARFASITKSSGINVNWNITANSLDQIIATLQKTDANSTWHPMIAYGSKDTGSTVYTAAQLVANPTTYLDNTGSLVRSAMGGDCFMNSYYFMRPCQALKDSYFSINNRPLSYGPLTPKEVFLQTLTALGYTQADLISGVNYGIFSLAHFLKYYFCHIIDLTIQDNSGFFISGLNTIGATNTITWTATFNGSSNSQTAIPILFARLTKVLEVRPGRQIMVY